MYARSGYESRIQTPYRRAANDKTSIMNNTMRADGDTRDL
jgi:hypothetical protein